MENQQTDNNNNNNNNSNNNNSNNSINNNEELEKEIQREEQVMNVQEISSTPTTSLNKNKLCQHKNSCIYTTLKTIIRGFAIGYGLRAGIALLTGLVLRRLYKNPKKLIKQSILHKEPIGFGLFLGLYTGGFKGVDCLLRNIRKKEDGLNSLIAGFVAGSAMMFSKSTEMALYLFARALESLFNAAVKRGYVKSYKHGDTLLFCLCTTIMFHGFVWEPSTVRPSYLKFLSKVAGKERDIGAITTTIRNTYYNSKKLLLNQ